MKILFLCVANSARSQIAEALAREIFGERAEVFSAGSAPSGVIHPWAIKVLEEQGIYARNQQSKGLSDLPRKLFDELDCVVTLCAEEICPTLNSAAKRLHWPIRDPAAAHPMQKGEAFRNARDEIFVPGGYWRRLYSAASTMRIVLDASDSLKPAEIKPSRPPSSSM